MITTLPESDKAKLSSSPRPRIVFKTWDDAMDYFAIHLKPIGHGPKGQAIYSRKDMDALNVQLPVDY
jgi:hypothetical protein